MKQLMWIIVLYAKAISVQAQSPFTNLGFDNPILTGVHGNPIHSNAPEGPSTELLIGWTLFQEGHSFEGSVGYIPGRPGLGTGGPRPGAQFALDVSRTATIGSFSLLIAGGPIVPGFPPDYKPVALQQTGTIPPEATILLIAGGLRPVMKLDGQTVPLTMWDENTKGYDIFEFAGKEVTLRFEFNSFGEFDIAGFRSVPEPSTWVLLIVGAPAFGLMSWRRVCRRRMAQIARTN